MYAVLGATGNTGSIVASRLLEKHQRVRVLGRDARRLQPLVQKGAEAVVAQAEDAAALARAFDGARGVYAMIPPAYSEPDPRAYQERVSDAICAAIREAAVPFLVLLSSIGADKPERTGPILGLRHFEQKLDGIAGLNALYLRAAFFLENFLPQIQVIRTAGIMAGGLDPALKIPMIATRDIGARAADALANLDFGGKRAQELHGAEDVASAQVAAVIGNAIGRPHLRYVKASDEQLRPALAAMGMPPAAADLILEIDHAINSGHIAPLEKRSPANTTPTTVAQFAAQVFAPAFRNEAAPN